MMISPGRELPQHELTVADASPDRDDDGRRRCSHILCYVTLTTTAIQPHHTARRVGGVACAVVLGLVTLAGCGGSSKPAYCSARASLENSIKDVTSLTASSGISSLEAAFTKVTTDANTLVSKAKSDFPSETSAIRSSVDALTKAVNTLKANPSASNIATVATAAGNTVSSVESFVHSTKSKCS
jgi:hypothetical protein